MDRRNRLFLFLLFALAAPAVATVTVSSPQSGASVNSPVHYSATATADGCASGVAAMGIYVNNQLVYQQNGSSLSTDITLANGSYYTFVQEWDKCGGSSGTAVNLTVGPKSTLNGVSVSSPANNSTVNSPVTYTATAGSTTCASGVAAMGIYVNNQLAYKQNGSSLSTDLSLNAGTYSTVVQEWDNCGGASGTRVNISVGAKSTLNGVSVSSPVNNSTVISPVTYTATAGTTSCAQGIASIGVYVDNSLAYVTNGNNLNTQLSIAPGFHRTAVQAWDNCNSANYTEVDINVGSVTIVADPQSIISGGSSTLNVSASGATQVRISGSDGSSYSLPSGGGSQVVSPSATTTYTVQASGGSGSMSAQTTVTVEPASSLNSVNHVIFMLQENRSFDNYFGMLNPYRTANGFNVGADGLTYTVDGIEDKLNKIKNVNDEGQVFTPFKLASSCVDDMTASWLESYGDVNRFDFSTSRQIAMDGFVHTAEAYAKSCAASNGTRCSGAFTETTGQRAMGYYDQTFLNYYYYMASQFALSDRWFSPISGKSIPNRIAAFSGGTTQGLVFDPGNDDGLPQLNITTIFQELDQANVPWKIYYTVTQGSCLSADDCTGGAAAQYPATTFGRFAYSYIYLYENPTGAACRAPAQPSSVVGDASNSFCIDPNHIAPLSQYYSDLTNGKLPSFSFIEAGYGQNDEHIGSGQSILTGQQQVAKVVNAFMASPAWKDSVFFLSYDEAGGAYDHVPPVPGHSNDYTDSTLGSTSLSNVPDISGIAKNPDGFQPCVPSGGTPTLHCDLATQDPGAVSGDVVSVNGFAAQLGFRVPNIVISPFTRKHFVSHIPMDHTAVLKFVENRFIGSSAKLTARDAVQPNLLDFFDFARVPWATPPTPPAPVSTTTLGYDPCTPTRISN